MQGIDNINSLPIWDQDMKAIADLMPKLPPDQHSGLRQQFYNRKAAIESGLTQVPPATQAKIKAVDPLLRVRWDVFDLTFIIERFGAGYECWHTVCRWWKYEDGSPFTADRMAAALRAGDTWRYANSDEWIEAKRAQSAKIKETRRKDGDQKVLAAVDAMSSKQIDQFIEAEQALASGDRVTFKGADAAKFEKMKKASAKAPPMPISPSRSRQVSPYHRKERKHSHVRNSNA